MTSLDNYFSNVDAVALPRGLLNGVLPTSPADVLRLDAADNVLCCVALLESMPDVNVLTENMRRLTERDVWLRSCPVETSSRGWAPIAGFKSGDWIEMEPACQSVADPFAYAARHLPSEFAQGTPMWRLRVLPRHGFSGGGAALVFYVHHALVDGLRGMSIMQEFSDGGVTARTATGISEGGNGIGADLGATWKLIRLLTHEWRVSHFLPKPKPTKASGARTFQAVHGDLDALRVQSRICGVSFPEAMLTVSASAVGDLVEQHGGTRPQRLPTIVPYLTRCARRFRVDPHSVLPLLASIPTCAGTALDHIALTQRSVAKAVSAISHEAHDLRARFYGNMPSALRRRVRDICARKTDLLFSVVPGPRHAMSFGGARVSALYGLPALIDPEGTALCVVTYNGKVFGAAASGQGRTGEHAQIGAAVSNRSDWMLEALQNV
jgi:hypothetical protein